MLIVTQIREQYIFSTFKKYTNSLIKSYTTWKNIAHFKLKYFYKRITEIKQLTIISVYGIPNYLFPTPKTWNGTLSGLFFTFLHPRPPSASLHLLDFGRVFVLTEVNYRRGKLNKTSRVQTKMGGLAIFRSFDLKLKNQSC